MATVIDEFPHHDSAHYANDEKQAMLTIALIGLFVVAMSVIAMIAL